MTFSRFQQSEFSLTEWLYACFLQLFIYPSIWVAMALASLGIYTQEVLELGHNWQAIALIFVSAFIPYNLDRIFDSYVQEIPESKAQLFFRQPYIWILLLIASVAIVVLFYHAPPRVRYVSLAGIIALLYGTPLFPWKNRSGIKWYRLKDIPGSKAWIVGGMVTYALIALPLAYAGVEFNLTAALITLFMFVFIVTNSHTFDIRDIESDLKKSVTTLPIMAGIRGTKIILTSINLLMLLFIVTAWATNIMAYYPEIILSTVANLVYIWAVNADTPRWVYSIWIEGCLFIPMVANLVIKAVF